MARFQPVEAFHPAEDTLELLPFRFERTDGHYLVSNVNRRPIGTPDRHPRGTPPFYALND